MKKSILSAVSGLAILLASNGVSLAQYLPQLFTDVSTGQQLGNPPYTLVVKPIRMSPDSDRPNPLT